MKFLWPVFSIVAWLVSPVKAGDVLKITHSGSVSEVKTSSFAKIVFIGDIMVAGGRFDLGNIRKIEFHADNAVGIRDTRENRSLPKQASPRLYYYDLKGRTILYARRPRIP